MTIGHRRFEIAGGGPDRRQPSFVIGRALGTVVVTLYDDLEPAGDAQLRDCLDDLTQGNLRVAVDLRRLHRLDAVGVELLVLASTWARRRGGSFSLHGPSPAVAAVLDAVSLGEIIAGDLGESRKGPPPFTERADARAAEG